MPRHRRPDIAEAVRAAYDLDPPGVLDTVAPEIVIVQDVDSLLHAETGTHYSMRAGVGAVVGQYSIVSLIQPPAAVGVLTEILLVYLDTICAFGLGSGVGVGGATGCATDLREITGRYRSACTLYGENNAATLISVHQGTCGGTIGYFFTPPQPMVLVSGRRWTFTTAAVNTDLNVAVWWREIPIVP